MATPKSVRCFNATNALNILFRSGGMSRADLARALGLNRSTMGNIVAGLLAAGLVVERPDGPRPEDARTGRPGIVVGLDPDGAWFLGAEIETNHIGVVAIDLLAQVRHRRSIAFDCLGQTAERVVQAVAALVHEVIAGLAAPRPVRGLCVTVPALLARGGIVRNAPILGWRDFPLETALRAHLPAVALASENDANAFAIAETYRATRDPGGTAVFLLLESGVGGGIVVGGRLVRGSSGLAGEFGHMPVGPDGYVNQEIRPGHLENYIGCAAVLACHRHHGGCAASIEEFLQHLDRAQPAATAAATEWAGWLGRGLLTLINILNPELIVLGGSVAPLYDRVAVQVQQQLRTGLIEGLPMPRIEVSRLGEHGAAIGAALLLHQRMFSINERILVAAITEAGSPQPPSGRTQGGGTASPSMTHEQTEEV